MALPYIRREDIHMRLNTTICMYEEEPYYVSTDDGRSDGNNITIYKLDGLFRPTKTIDHRDDKFSDRSVPLGYMQYEDKAHYLSRMPQRMQNQAVTRASIVGMPQGLGARWFTSKAMRSCILGEHKTFKQAWKMIENGEFSSVPIHRYVALKLGRRDMELHYKGRLVAQWNENLDYWEYLKSDDRSFIQRAIERLGVL